MYTTSSIVMIRSDDIQPKKRIFQKPKKLRINIFKYIFFFHFSFNFGASNHHIQLFLCRILGDWVICISLLVSRIRNALNAFIKTTCQFMDRITTNEGTFFAF